MSDVLPEVHWEAHPGLTLILCLCTRRCFSCGNCLPATTVDSTSTLTVAGTWTRSRLVLVLCGYPSRNRSRVNTRFLGSAQDVVRTGVNFCFDLVTSPSGIRKGQRLGPAHCCFADSSILQEENYRDINEGGAAESREPRPSRPDSDHGIHFGDGGKLSHYPIYLHNSHISTAAAVHVLRRRSGQRHS